MPRIVRESDSRDVFLEGYIGHNRTGKTSLARRKAELWIQNNPNGIVAGFDPQNKFSDLLDIVIRPADKSYGEKILRLRNALLILDDYRILHPNSKSEPWLLDLMQFRSEYCIDIIYITHNPKLVLETLTYYTTHYYIFYTESRLGSWQDKIPNYIHCQTASMFINKYVSIHGKGSHPNFPHIIVDCLNQKLIAQNIQR
jgi:hypothetical protein